jgi:hypothetical protein
LAGGGTDDAKPSSEPEQAANVKQMAPQKRPLGTWENILSTSQLKKRRKWQFRAYPRQRHNVCQPPTSQFGREA